MRRCLKTLGIALLAALEVTAQGAVAEVESENSSIPGLTAEAQFRPSIDGYHYPLLEVYLTNRTRRPVRWKRAFLNGVEVANMTNGCVWTQFYPSRQTAPGGTTELQICLKDRPTQPQTVEVEDSEGRRCSVRFTSFLGEEVHLTGLTFSEDLREAYVVYETMNSDPSLLQVSVNGVNLTKVARLKEIPTFKYPALVVIPLPKAMKPGEAFYVRMSFDDQVVHALVRVSRGIMLDDSGVADDNLREDLGLDPHPIARLIGSDPAGYEHDGNDPGKGAAKLMEIREKWLVDSPGRLAYENLGQFASAGGYYAVYGQMADAIAISPDSLAFSDSPRFIEVEEKQFGWLRRAVEPRPIYWTHEVLVFQGRDRMLEPGEFRLLAWAALANGVKGIIHSTYSGSSPEQKGYSLSAPLLAEIRKFNQDVKALEPYLAPAIPVSTAIPIWETDHLQCEAVQVYTLWSGDKGQLVIVRDLKYKTDHLANASGAEPRFHYSPRGPMTVSVHKPRWLSPVLKDAKPEVTDLLTQETMEASMTGNAIQITLPKLDLVRVLWIPNGPPAESLAPAQGEPGEDPPKSKPRILAAEEPALHLAASMQLLEDPVNHGVYAILFTLKNTSSSQDFMFTKSKGSWHGIGVNVLRAGKWLSDSEIRIECFGPPVIPDVVKIPPRGTHEWLLPIADCLKEKLPANEVLENCYLSVTAWFLDDPPKPKLFTLQTLPTPPPQQRKGYLSLHDSKVTLTGKALEGDAKQKFKKYGRPDSEIK